MKTDALAQLDALIAESSPAERAALVVGLAARLAALGAGLASTATQKDEHVDAPTLNVSVEEGAKRLGVSPR